MRKPKTPKVADVFPKICECGGAMIATEKLLPTSPPRYEHICTLRARADAFPAGHPLGTAGAA